MVPVPLEELAETQGPGARTRATGQTGFQNGLALAGDYMSAASFLGIAGLVALRGYDGMIYATGWLVGWPALMFLIAEPLRNLGKFTFADVVAFRLRQVPVRIAAAGLKKVFCSLNGAKISRWASSGSGKPLNCCKRKPRTMNPRSL